MAANEVENNATDSNVFRRSMNENEPLLSEHHDVTHILSKVRFPSCRLVLLIMGFLGFVNVYCLRANLGVALVAMVNYTHQPYGNMSGNYSRNNTADICIPVGETAFDKEDTTNGEFNWDSNTQGTVLAAFFYGYITTQVRVFAETCLFRCIFSW